MFRILLPYRLLFELELFEELSDPCSELLLFESELLLFESELLLFELDESE